MEKKLVVSPSPHIHGADSTKKLMRDVLIALLPAFAVSVIVYGIDSVIVTGVAVIACVVFEYLIQKYMLRRAPTIYDCSAILTGVLLGFNLPSSLPVWMIVLGALFAIGVGKMSFGGLGRNPFNPALVGRVFLLISFPVQMTGFVNPARVDALVSPVSVSSGATAVADGAGEAWGVVADSVAAGRVDAVTGPTLLGFVRESLNSGAKVSDFADQLSYTDMLLGFKSGSIGEIAALALLLGFFYLLYRKVITWHIPVYVLGSMAAFSGILWAVNPEQYLSPLFHILTGGALLGAIFMATDYVTSPMTPKGMAIYGVGIGVITMLIRVWGSYPEGVSFAILIMNATVPLLNKYVKPKRFGVVTKTK